MESTRLGVILDSSVLIAAERRGLTPEKAIETVRATAGEFPIVLYAIAIAVIGHGIYRAKTPEMRDQQPERLRPHTRFGDPSFIAFVWGESGALSRGLARP